MRPITPSRPRDLEAVGAPGRGRLLRWTFPDRPAGDPFEAGELEPIPAAAPSPLPKRLTGTRVLVVDDDEDTVELFATALAACGAEVATAGSAQEALHALARWHADVVVSDIAMPGGDGYWLVREIRRLPDADRQRVPVVAVTAFGREHSKARALAAGFADHLQKPVDPEVLCQTVARASRR